MHSPSDNAERLLLHVEGDTLCGADQRLLEDFEATMRALGHTVDRHHHVDQPEPSRIVWVFHDSGNPGAGKDAPERTYTSLQSLCAIIDLVYIHDNSALVQDTYDLLMGLPWHERAYCFDVPRGEVQLLAKILATLLASPSQRRLPQVEAEQLMRIV